MLPTDWSQVDKDAIDRLITNAVPESVSLEYKEQLATRTDGDKKEFLADVSSLANASGGDLIFGISEARDADGRPTNLPSAAAGVAGLVEADKSRLESMIMDGIAPRIAVQLKLVAGFPQGPVLVVRVPRSWSGPHMVTFQNTSRFYSRNSAGKFQLDVHQMRGAFAQAELLPEKVRSLRLERIGRIMAGEAAGAIGDHQAVIVHLIPYVSFSQGFTVDVRKARNDTRLKPIGSDGWSRRYNLDGAVATVRGFGDYTQIFRNGVIEAVLTIPGAEFSPLGIERYVGGALPSLRDLVHALGAGAPVALMLTIVNVRGLKAELPSNYIPMPGTEHVVDRNELALPDHVLTREDEDLRAALRPAFDAMWQACGFEGSPSYGQSPAR